MSDQGPLRGRYDLPADEIARCSNCGELIGDGEEVIYDLHRRFCDYRCHNQWKKLKR